MGLEATRSADPTLRRIEPAVADRREFFRPPPRPPVDDIEVTSEFVTAADAMRRGSRLSLVTGPAGSGKSTFIRYLLAEFPVRTAVVAPTGVAALNCGGQTIHSFFGFPPRFIDLSEIKNARDQRLFKKLKLLIIDEISMVRADLFDAIERFLRLNGPTSEDWFGGVQIVCVGDMFQLPPVVASEEEAILLSKYRSPFFFSAHCLRGKPISILELTRVFRQSDPEFMALLHSIRMRDENLPETLAAINKSSSQELARSDSITLTTTNAAADTINRRRLRELPHPEKTYNARITGHFRVERSRPASPEELTLRLSARVMFTKNDARKRWVNGTLGKVERMRDASVDVRLDTGESYEVGAVSWDQFEYVYNPSTDSIAPSLAGQFVQLPLTLAWGVTIHKAQGLTLDNVIVDVSSGAFLPGQVYVALSRCRTLRGLRVATPIGDGDVQGSPEVRRFQNFISKRTSSNLVQMPG